MIMKFRSILGLMVAGACLLSLWGCGFKKSYPAKRYYQLTATRTGEPARVTDQVLRIQTLEIAVAFSGKGLVSRISEVEFESDYYAEFFSAPNEMVSEQLRTWLRASGRYPGVIGAASTLTADLVVEGFVDGLYVDRRNPSEIRAVLSIQLRYIDDRGPKPEVLSTRAYQGAEIVGANDGAIVQGWNRALESVLGQIERDLTELR